jgi:predicted phosphate transport protein (TIGR00153 family)
VIANFAFRPPLVQSAARANAKERMNLLPRDNTFFDLFEGLSKHVVVSAERLRSLAQGFPDIEQHLKGIREAEHDADDIAHAALARLDTTFITPFDREDIHTLVGGLDDIVDTVDAVAKRFPMYHVKVMEPSFVKMTEVLVLATQTVSDAIHRLRKCRKLTELSEKLIEIHRLENVGDDINHAAVSALFENGGADALNVMKWKELYDLAEAAIDNCEDVGNTIERIVLKNG